MFVSLSNTGRPRLGTGAASPNSSVSPQQCPNNPVSETFPGQKMRKSEINPCANTETTLRRFNLCRSGCRSCARAPTALGKEPQPLVRKRATQKTHKMLPHRLRFWLSNTVSSSLSREPSSMFSSWLDSSPYFFLWGFFNLK